MAFEIEDLMIDVFPARGGLFLNERCTCQISPNPKPPPPKGPPPKDPKGPPPKDPKGPPPKDPPPPKGPHDPGHQSAGAGCADLAVLRDQLRASLA